MKQLVVLSGGLDSTVLAYHIRNQATLVGCVSVNYGQRHSKELLCAAITCKRLDVPHHLVDLSTLRNHLTRSSLTSDRAIPEGHYAEESMKQTVVPNRNMILLAIAAGIALTVKAEAIAYAAHSGDHAIYPDCRPEFASAMDKAIGLCDYEPPVVNRPFIHLTKAEIVTLGRTHAVPFDETWSCYKGEERACGRCGTCVERLEAFHLAQTKDPLRYTDEEYWRTATESAETFLQRNTPRR